MEGNVQTEYASLSGKIHTIVIDKTLSISGACADAKATGDEIAKAAEVYEEAKEAYENARADVEETVNNAVNIAIDNIPTISTAKIMEICV